MNARNLDPNDLGPWSPHLGVFTAGRTCPCNTCAAVTECARIHHRCAAKTSWDQGHRWYGEQRRHPGSTKRCGHEDQFLHGLQGDRR